MAAALAVAASTLAVEPAHAAGGFTAVFGPANPLAALGNYNLGTYVSADLDADGDLDVAARERFFDATVDVLRNDGGTFTTLTGAASPFAGISFPGGPLQFLDSRVLVGDFDVDGDVDLWHHGTGFAALYRNDGPTFSEHTGAGDPLHDLATRDPGSYVVLDVDGDTDPDVVAREPTGDASLELFRNDGGTFTVSASPFAAIAFAPSASQFLNVNVLVLDADGDGDLDLWHHGAGFAALYRNDGATFSEHTGAGDPLEELGAYYSHSYTVLDVDSDGDVDVAAREPSTGLAVDVFRNDGGAGFTRLTGGASPFAAAPLATTDWETAYLLAGDHDGDGDADVYNHADDRFYAQAGSAPVVTARTPARGTTGVPVASTLTLTLDEPVVLGSGDVVLRNAAGGAVIERISAGTDPARFTGVGTATITITPSAPLPFATTVTVSVEPRTFVSSSDGDAFAGVDPITWRFTTAANTPPVLLGLDGDSVTFTEGDAPVPVDGGAALAVGDDDGIGFAGGTLTVALGAGAVAGEDHLAAPSAGHLGTVVASPTGIAISLGAGANATTVAAWLRAVAYANDGGDDPTPGDRTVDVTLEDAQGLAATAHVTVSVVPVDDPPVITAPSGYIVTAGSVVTIRAVTVEDVDSDTVELRGETNAGTFGDGGTTMHRTATPAELTAAIDAGQLTWHAPHVAMHGTLRLTVDDGVSTDVAELSLHVNAPPTPRSPDAGGTPSFVVAPLLGATPPAPWEDPIDAAARRAHAAATATGDGEGPDAGTRPAATTAHRSSPVAAARRNPDRDHRSPHIPWAALAAAGFGAALIVLFVRHRRDEDRRARGARRP